MMFHHKVIKYAKITFIFNHKKIFIENFTGTFYLEPIQPYWTHIVGFIGVLIEMGEINNYEKLLQYIRGKLIIVPCQPLKDVVYVYKKTPSDELRFSIRTLSNLTYRNLIIVGDKPDWLKNIIHIPSTRLRYTWAKPGNPYHDAETKWRDACLSEHVSNNFILFNDDFFVMKYTPAIPIYNRGLISERLKTRIMPANELHLSALRQTMEFLNGLGIKDPLDYGLHLPMIMNKFKRLEVSKLMEPHLRRGKILLARTIYGNLYNLEGIKIEDVKNPKDYKNKSFLSSTAQTFEGDMGKYIKKMFPEKSIFEVDSH